MIVEVELQDLTAQGLDQPLQELSGDPAGRSPLRAGEPSGPQATTRPDTARTPTSRRRIHLPPVAADELVAVLLTGSAHIITSVLVG